MASLQSAVKNPPTDRIITDDKEGARNARSWVLWFNSIGSLLRGITTTVFGLYIGTNLQIEGLPSQNYANDAAAAAGGVPIGGLYHTAGTVKVRLI